MTRLRKEDIDRIAPRLEDYDVRLIRTTGASLRQIACCAAGVKESLILDLLHRVRFATVPVSSGLGVIDGFSDAVAAIVSHLGFEAFATERCDHAGLAEALDREATVLLLADDERFIARSLDGVHLVDNSWATGRGFVAGLELMHGGLEGEAVLVLGCGRLGLVAAEALISRGAVVALCDIDPKRASETLHELGLHGTGGIRVEDSLDDALGKYEMIFDATNSGSFIEASHLSPRSMVAAPGLPCALTPEAMAEHRDRVLHDALEIGVATMAVEAAAEIAVPTELAGRGESVVGLARGSCG
jgi:pyrrolysine biosynthesis protein PylD